MVSESAVNKQMSVVLNVGDQFHGEFQQLQQLKLHNNFFKYRRLLHLPEGQHLKLHNNFFKYSLPSSYLYIMYPIKTAHCKAMATKNNTGDKHGGGTGQPPTAAWKSII
jgi:hypothetical protein